MPFVWDDRKNGINQAKHGVSFADAATAFGDPLSRTIADPDHSFDESRSLLIGLTSAGRLVVVAHADRGRFIRIISARFANRRERRVYEEEGRNLG
ncbi:BrnT family toxin [Myxococcota bacterium]|nr:BrnT family toxin [Myxococcota bacterium]